MDDPIVRLERWTGPVSEDDPDANFKRDVALYANVDPLRTVTNLATALDLPVGAVVRYVLARWASAGSESLLAAGPSVIGHMHDTCVAAEEAGTEQARLKAYETLRQLVEWLQLGLEGEGY
jgi:pyruvoyl-dependent arginine decarboxylase (PvlArgDC)